MARVLILGEHGQLALALQRRLKAQHQLTVAGRAVLDLADPGAAAAFVMASDVDVVVNAAGYTAVDAAEDEPDAAFALNAVGPAAAAAAAHEIGAAFIHFSSDYVFDGAKGAPYIEADLPGPLGVYGASKLAGEQAIAAANPRHLILRTAWVCSPDGTNFFNTMLRLAGERHSVGVVDDQTGCPTFAHDLAEVVAQMIDSLVSRSDSVSPGGRTRFLDHLDETFGIFNAAGQGETTWCGFAQAIMAGSAARGGPACEVNPLTSADYPTRARRPADTRLDSARLEQVYGLRLPDWRDGLARCLDTLYEHGSETGGSA